VTRILEGRNTLSDEQASSFLGGYEDHLAELERLKIEHMNKCRAVREMMKELLDDAKAQGIAKGDIKDAAKARALRAKLHELLTDREDDSRVKGILEAIGDDFASFGLGAAAVAREGNEETGGQDPTTAAIVAAASKEWGDAEPAKKPRKH
jgi:hypothetical protein